MIDEPPTGTDPYESLRGLLVETGHAHHEAIGPVDDDWAAWYASYLEGRLDQFVGFSPNAETIRDWLVSADERYRTAESPDDPWPIAYARFILDDYAR